MQKSLFNKSKKELLIFVGLALFTFYFMLNSPLSPFYSNAISGIDSNVFRTVAFMMKKGYMPYRDTFDHKGPLIYIFNYLGLVISFNHGIWLIEYIAMLVTVLFSFKIARLISNSYLQSLFVSLISVAYLINYKAAYFQGGNFTEEFALPFITISLYICLEYIIKNRLSLLKLVVCGASFGCVCMLRANMIAVWVVFCLALFIRMLIKKEFVNVLKCVGGFLLGTIGVFIPILVWLLLNGALHDFWFDYIVFNFLYTASATVSINDKLETIKFFAVEIVLILALITVIYSFIKNIKKQNDRFLYGTYFVYFLVNIILVSISGLRYLHYGMIIAPALVFPLSVFFVEIKKKLKRPFYYLAVVVFFIYSLLYPCTVTAILIDTYSNEKNIYSPIVELVEANSNADESISVYGNNDIIYVMSNRIHATKYSYQFPIGKLYQPIMDDYFNSLELEKPRIIVVTPLYRDENILAFVDTHNYELIDTTDDEYEIYLYQE